MKSAGVLLYRIPRDALDAYRGMNAIDLEQRADRVALRGADLGRRSVFRPRWRCREAQRRGARSGWTVSRRMDIRSEARAPIAISGRAKSMARSESASIGSASGLKPIIDSYGADAEKIYFPYPRLWSPNGARTFHPRSVRAGNLRLDQRRIDPVDGDGIRPVAPAAACRAHVIATFAQSCSCSARSFALIVIAFSAAVRRTGYTAGFVSERCFAPSIANSVMK